MINTFEELERDEKIATDFFAQYKNMTEHQQNNVRTLFDNEPTDRIQKIAHAMKQYNFAVKTLEQSKEHLQSFNPTDDELHVISLYIVT